MAKQTLNKADITPMEPAPRILMTVDDLLKQIPDSWRKERIAISLLENKASSVHSVRLVTNDNGSKVIVIASNQMEMKISQK